MKLSPSQLREVIDVLSQGFLGRYPNPNGVQYWSARIESGEPALKVLSDFLLSSESQARKAGQEKAPELVAGLAKLIDDALCTAPMLVVDVGAQTMQGEDHIYSPLLTHAKSRVIGFEPLEHRRREREEAETNIDLSMRSAFIGDGSRHTFHMNLPDPTSSLLPLNHAVIDDLVDLCSFQTVSTENISTVTLDKAISDIERVDFLKLDIQGFEYPALANARSALSRTLVIHCEVEFLPLYHGQGLFSEIDQLLRESGFRFVDFNHLRRYPFRCGPLVAAQDQLVWGDAVYFRDMNLLSNSTELLIQSFIAVAVYGKASLARFLIREYDKRDGTSYEVLFDV